MTHRGFFSVRPCRYKMRTRCCVASPALRTVRGPSDLRRSSADASRSRAQRPECVLAPAARKTQALRRRMQLPQGANVRLQRRQAVRFSAAVFVAAWHCRLFRAFRYKTSSHEEANPVRTLVIALLSAVVVAPLGAAAATCTRHGVELQVLGSGGPELEDKRASTSYLIWQDGAPRILVDSGGGSAQRFGEAGAHVAQLDAILFTHLHVDHSADFAAVIKSSYFEQRLRALPVYGPAGNAGFPSTTEFVADLFDPKRGAYRYLGDFLLSKEGGYA